MFGAHQKRLEMLGGSLQMFWVESRYWTTHSTCSESTQDVGSPTLHVEFICKLLQL